MATRKSTSTLPARPTSQPACFWPPIGVIGSTVVAKPGTLLPSPSRLRPPQAHHHSSKAIVHRPPSIFSGHINQKTGGTVDPQRVPGTRSLALSPPAASSGSRRSILAAAGGGSQSSTAVVKSQQREALVVARSLTSAGTLSTLSQTLNQPGNNFSGELSLISKLML